MSKTKNLEYVLGPSPTKRFKNTIILFMYLFAFTVVVFVFK